MSAATVRVDTSATRGANLRTIAREFARMDDAKVKGIFRDRLTAAARPFVPAVRASVLAVPVKGEVPYHQPPGLRARIAACAETASWESGARQVSVAVQIQPQRMPDGQKGLPLYMEGVPEGRHNRWRHPVFGSEAQLARFFARPRSQRGRGGHGRAWTWVTQPPKPYFYQAAGGFGRAAEVAMRAALDDITHQLNG